MIENGWYDGEFVRRWTNAPLLVRADTGRLLRAAICRPAGDPAHYVGVGRGRRGGRSRTTRRAAGTTVDEAQLALVRAREVRRRAAR